MLRVIAIGYDELAAKDARRRIVCFFLGIFFRKL
jgi:hypothetical protein